MRLRFGPAGGDGQRLLDDGVLAFHSRAQSILCGPSRAGRDAADRRSTEGALCREIARLHPGLLVEVRVGPAARHVAVSPGADEGLSPLCEHVVARSPEIPGVTFCRHLPALGVQESTTDVVERTGVDLSGARARLGFSRGHLLEAVVFSPVYSSRADERGLEAADLLVRRLLGDALFDEWFGAVEIAPLPRGGPLRMASDGKAGDTLPLSEVLPATHAAVSAVRASLAAEPLHLRCDREDWTLFELSPTLSDDHGGLEDLAIFSTMVPEAMKSCLEGARFSSSRFSNHGERFVYVKVDAVAASPRERMALKSEIEDMLSFALSPGGIGAVVGAGVGLRYVYVVLALSAVERGLAVVRKKLQALGVDTRSWILFCDGEWSYEWVGIWDETPPPPDGTRRATGAG